MDDTIFKDEVKYWDDYFAAHPNADKKLFELAFFKIFVKFELFISEIFVHYCIGEQSIKAFSPTRKLSFLDRNHFDSVIKNGSNSSYIDYFQKMQDLAPHIFEERFSPFVIFSSANYSQNIIQMRILRNYIAHESLSAKSNYTKKILNGRFMEPYQFLLKKKKQQGVSNYTYFIDSMINISEYILDPNPVS